MLYSSGEEVEQAFSAGLLEFDIPGKDIVDFIKKIVRAGEYRFNQWAAVLCPTPVTITLDMVGQNVMMVSFSGKRPMLSTPLGDREIEYVQENDGEVTFSILRCPDVKGHLV